MNFENIKSQLIRLREAGKIPMLAAACGISINGLRKIASGQVESPRLCTLEAINRAIKRKEFK
jgi:transcriptional regulator with XRE-family HTH domain